MMRQLKVKTFAAQCALVVGMMGAVNVAVGAVSSSRAVIDWSSLSWTATNGATLIWTGSDDYVSAEYWNAGVSTDFNSAGPASNPVVSASSVGSGGSGAAYAFGLTTDSLVRSGAFTGDPGEETQGAADRYNDFLVDGAGGIGNTDITFTVNYVMVADVTSGIGESNSMVGFELFNNFIGGGVYDDDFVSQIGTGTTGNVYGSFSLTETFFNGETGYIYGGTSSYAFENNLPPAGVPEPGVLPLLGIGLLGLWGASRRRTA